MSLPGLTLMLGAVERGLAPDALIRLGIRRLCEAGLKERASRSEPERKLFRDSLHAQFRSGPIAVHTDEANQQHYELPPEFFALCLGPHRKYSGCYWPTGVTTLEQAEAASLTQVCERAELADGQDILELGCGWGSLSLWMAQRYPRSRIVAVSNSRPQREFIEARCRERGLTNVSVSTCDINRFAPPGVFDRIVSIEMFEHMRNYAELLRRIAGWLRPAAGAAVGGKLFVHIFAHVRESYLFERDGPANWMGRHFFTGGVMPAVALLPEVATWPEVQPRLTLEAQWQLDGTHYQRTAEAWLLNMDRHKDRVLELFEPVYGPAPRQRWRQRWRVFYLACAEMFGYAQGAEWGVAHYRFARGAS